MTKVEKEIIAILEDGGFSQNLIEEIIIKDKDHAIISIEIATLKDSQAKIQENAKSAENKIAKNLDFKKVTIILVINKNSKKKTVSGKTKASKVSKSSKDNAKTPDKKQKIKKQGALEKIKNVFRRRSSDAKNEGESNFTDENQKQDQRLDSGKGDAQEPQPNQPEKISRGQIPVAKKLKNVKHIIAIASAKGGVGKSSLAANIAVTFARIGYKTALVDADIYGPSIAHIMNIDEKPQIKDGGIVPHFNYGVKFISIANIIKKEEAGVWRGSMINKILNQLMAQTNWSHDGQDVDLLIVDMPPGTGDIYLSLAQNFDLSGAVLVSTPQCLSEIDLVRSVDCFEKLNVKILGLIENMSFYEDSQGEKIHIFGEGDLQGLAKKKNIDFMGQIPIIPQLGQSSHDRNPLSSSQPNHAFSHQVGLICENILDKIR